MYSANMSQTSEEKTWNSSTEMISVLKSDELCDIFDKYVKLRKVSEFFVKLCCSLEELQTENYVFPANLLRKVSELVPYIPIGQAVEIWESLLRSTLKLLDDKQSDERCFLNLLLIAEMLRLFLLHLNIDTDHNRWVNKKVLFIDTTNLLQRMCALCHEGPVQPHLAVACLGLCYAWGELHLSMKMYSRIYQEQNPSFEVVKPVHLFDISIVHNYCTSESWINVINNMENVDDKRKDCFLILLLLQKVKAILLTTDMVQVETESIKAIVGYLIKILKEYPLISTDVAWNGQPTYITSKLYPIAMWYCILKHLPCLRNYLKPKQWAFLSATMIQVLMNSPTETAQTDELTIYSITVEFVKSQFFVEVKHLQCTFITEIWHIASSMFQNEKRKSDCDLVNDRRSVFDYLYSSPKIWIKWANTTPKSQIINDNGLNEMWEKIKSASQSLNNMLDLKGKQKADFKNLLKLIKILNYLPLEYLLPGNQMNCLLGLFTIMSCVKRTKDISEQIDLCHIMAEIGKIASVILNGARSVWLLSFFDASSLLNAIVKATMSASIKIDEYLSIEEEMYKWIQQLLNSIMCMSVKKFSTLSGLQEFAYSAAVVQECDSNKILVSSMLTLLSKLNETLAKIQNDKLNKMFKKNQNNEFKNLCQKIAQQIIYILKEFIRKESIKNEPLQIICYKRIIEFNCILNDECIIEPKEMKKVLRKILKIVKKNEDAKLYDVSLEFCTMLCKSREKLKDYIPEDFMQELWLLLIAKMFKGWKMDDNSDKIGMDFEKIDKLQFKLINNSIDESLKNVTLISESSSLFDFDSKIITNGNVPIPNEFNTLQAIVTHCTKEEHVKMVQNLSNTVNVNSENLKLTSICRLSQMWKIIIDVNSQHQNSLWIYVQLLIQKLCNFLFKLNLLLYDNLNILQVILDLFVTILHKGKSVVNHQSVLYCLESCIIIPLKHTINHPLLYVFLFKTIYNVLNEMIVQHSNSVICAASTFTAYISHLVCCQIQASNQSLLVKYDQLTIGKLESCAQNLQKLMSLLTKHKTEFSKLVSNIIASYVSEVATVTVFPSIKDHLMFGLYKLISISDAHTLNMVNQVLKFGSKEVFKAILDDYKSHFKYYGHV